MQIPERHLNSRQREVMRERLLARVQQAEGCWQWLGPVDDEGYARIRVPGFPTKLAVHRVSYEVFVGRIPDGLTIDHLCRNPSCANPKHLEPVPMLVNIRRGHGIGMKNAAKTACRQGHPYVAGSFIEEQVGGGKVGRRCVICRRERERIAYHSGRGSRAKANRRTSRS